MRIDELYKITKQNRFNLIDDELAVYIYGYSHGDSDEFKTEIWISKSKAKDIVIETGIYCEEEEFNVMKAAIKFAETPLEDRNEEEKDKENRPNWMTRWLGEPVRDCEVGRQDNL